MNRIAKFIIRYRLIIGVLILIITLFLGFEATKIKINPDIVSYFPKSDPVVKTFNTIGSHFGGNQIAMIAINSPNLFTPRIIKKMVAITDSLSNMEGISSVIDMVNTIDITSENGDITIRKLIDEDNIPITRAAIDSLKNRLRTNKMYIGTVISKDLGTAMILCKISNNSDEMEVVNSIKLLLKRNFSEAKIYTGGIPFLLFAISKSILHDIKLLVPILALVMILILLLSYRSLRGVVLPLASVTISIIWTIGIMVLAGKEFTILSDIIPVLLLAVGSAYSIHILSKFEELKTSNISNREKAEKALSNVLLPVFLAAVTTMIGFISFLFGSFFTMIREFGIFSSLGVLFAFVVSVLIVPICLSYLPDKTKHSNSESDSRLSHYLMSANETILRHGKVGLIFTSVVIVIAIIGTFFIQRKVSYTDYFGKNSEIKRSEILISKEFGGSSMLQILVEGNPKDPKVLKEIYDFENYLKEINNVNNTNSIADIIVRMNKIVSGNEVIPSSTMKINNLWFLLEGEEMINNMVDLNNNEALIQASLDSDLSLKETKVIVAKIEEYIKKHSNESVKFHLTGMPLINIKLDASIVKSQIFSLIIAFVSILIIMILLTHSFVGGLIGIVPVAFTLILIFGVMGLINIPLDIATALVGSISMGIGIDYSIHFIERFRKEVAKTDKKTALKATLNTTGKAIFINMLVVISGFCVLVFANLVPLRRFGILISITMIGSAFGATVILSSILVSIKKNIFKKEVADE